MVTLSPFEYLASHKSRQPFQNHPSGQLGAWAMPWSAEEMLDGQRQEVDIPDHAGTAQDGLPRRKDCNRISAESSRVSPSPPLILDPFGRGTDLT